jgi:hypothetical protein
VISSSHGSGTDKREWTVDLKSSPPFVGQSDQQPKGAAKPDVEIALSDELMLQLAQGKMKPDQVGREGK